jgi:hypothetical protein
MTADNVVPFERRPSKGAIKADDLGIDQPPALTCVELRLNDEDCGLEMTAADEDGNLFLLRYSLASAPAAFDLDLLRQAWARWRDTSAAAS